MGRPRDAGFTLTELLIVVAIIAVVAAIAVPNLLAAKLSSNEAAAIATLRTLVSAQAQVQGTGRIDTDNDSIGEHGTLVELIGEFGVRRGFQDGTGAYLAGSFFGVAGPPLKPPALSPTLLEYLGARGELEKSGYGIMVFLPDARPQAGWVHEWSLRFTFRRGTRSRTLEFVALSNESGGPGLVGVDLSESTWCAYARPVRRGSSGNRAFFTNQQGDILQSANEAAKHEVNPLPIRGESAFLGAGITSALAVGTAGADGDVWKVTN
ncbi:MAG: prepilin-type N-terminal cleavage/methylation domain-containing protein [Planctomycetes bacterium]|nr:prepilin-type N-terminal cleavage/methylation domain-containing protein [Planctomycetota bacterium]